MKTPTNRLARIALSFVAIIGLNLAAHAQYTTTWTGGAGNNEWTNGLNWDDGNEPDNATGTNNAIIPIGSTVDYDEPMLAAAFGGLTNSGILNISTNGFNCGSVSVIQPGGGDRIFVNNGGVVSMTGSLIISSNASVTVSAGASLTAATLQLGNANTAGSTAFFTNSGGNITATTTSINNNDASASSVFYVIGGTNNLGNVTIRRASPSSQPALGSEGLVISNGIVTMTSLNVGGNANSYTTMFMPGGLVTNSGTFLIQESTSGRNARFIQTGGIFVNAEPNTINPDPAASGDISIVSVTGGTNITGGLQFGASGGTAGTVNFTNTANLYVGAEGIISNGAVTLNCRLNNGGLFGATADWVGSANMTLNGGTFTFQAADMTGTPHNITLNNPLTGTGALNKTGNGTLTLNGANTYSGATLINGGTLALGATGSLGSPIIVVGPATTFDVSALGGAYSPATAQTLAGWGTINGLVTATAGTIEPGSNALSGTLTFGSGLTEQGNVVNELTLSSNPSGPGNDLINVLGDFTASGANTILINGSITANSVYPLIQYSGNFNGSLSSFAISGATGSLSNNATTRTIYFISVSAVRAPTNVVWIGNASSNRWDTEQTTNWNNNGTLDFFVPGDSARFDNTGRGNTNVSIVGSVAPGSLTVDSSSNYFFVGAGSIDGAGALIKTNSGTLTIATTNTYSGGTMINGGVLSIDTIANGGVACALGSASSDPGTLVLNGGTLAYTGASAGTDHGITLTNAGGTIDVIGGSALTLNGNLVGPGGLTQVDTGTLVLNGTGNTYAGGTTVANGSLQLNSGSAAGAGSITFDNGTLVYYPSGGITVTNPFDIADGTTNMLVVTSGSGANPISSGPWSGGGLLMISNTYSPITVNGNLDGVTGTIQLITPNGSAFRFNSGGGNTCFGSTNATFDLGSGSGQLICRNAGTMNLGALTGGPSTTLANQDADTGTVIYSIGNNNLSTTFAGSIVDDPGANRLVAITKVGTGTLTLTGTSTYTGATIVDSGTLQVDGQITASYLTIAGGTLAGVGTLGGYSVEIQPGATFLPGDGLGQMTINNTLQLDSGSTNVFFLDAALGTSSSVAAGGVSYAGNLVVSNLAGTFTAGQTFTLFVSSQYYGGAWDSITLPPLGPGLTWDTSQLAVNGSIVVRGALEFTSVSQSGGNLILVGSNGPASGNYEVLASTNLALPLSSWAPVATNAFNPDGSFSVTNPITPGVPRQFFMLQEVP